MKIVNGKEVPETPEDLAQIEADRLAWEAAFPKRKAAAIEQLNKKAEEVRHAWVTPGSAKSLEYEAKRREAESILADIASGASPDPTKYPFASRRAARLGVTLEAVAKEWKDKTATWDAAAAEIADLVETAKEEIKALNDPSTFSKEAELIFQSIVWPLPKGVQK